MPCQSGSRNASWLNIRRVSAGLLLTVAILTQSIALADVFDDHTAYWIKQAAETGKPATSLGLKDGSKLKPIGKRISTPCIVVKTDDDNWTKALVTWGLRKGKNGPTPVLIIERFVTYRGDRPNLTTAAGKDIMLFPGFSFNFDIGQVVPEGQGEDIKCEAEATLTVADAAKLYPLDGPAVPETTNEKPKPTDHSEVLPEDFVGTWVVRIDGRWEGRWELKVDDRRVYGKFVSDSTKSEYELNGRIAGLAHNARFDVELANTSQTFDAYLWTKDKSAIAGTVVIAERKVGFYALRATGNE